MPRNFASALLLFWAMFLRAASLSLFCFASVSRAAEEPPAFPAEMRLSALPARPVERASNLATPEKIALGRMLFFDPILSATRTVACATCHHPKFAWADGRATPLGVGALGLGAERRLEASAVNVRPIARNVPSLLNVGFVGLVTGVPHDPAAAPLFWDGRALGLEAQVLHPIQARDEMQGDVLGGPGGMALVLERLRGFPEYLRLFRAAFPGATDEAIGAEHLTQAIAAFERTIVAAEAPFDRYLRGEEKLAEPQLRGLKVLETAGCIQCHGGPMFSDFKMHFIGVTDSSPDGRRALRTPTLRNLKQTAPYMHHGGLRTIRDVLVFYEALSDAVSETLDGADSSAEPPLDPLLKKLNLTADQFPDLEAFLETLNDDRYDRSAPERVPSGLPVAGVR